MKSLEPVRKLVCSSVPFGLRKPFWQCSDRFLIQLTFYFLFLSTTVQAAITTTGDVDPSSDPNTWTTSTCVYVGKVSEGALVVDDGSSLSTFLSYSYIGYARGSQGVATVSGDGSMWKNGFLYVGVFGHGGLNITDGGTVISVTAWLGCEPTSTGTVTVSGSGSAWNSGFSTNGDPGFAVGRGGMGTLRIIDGGVVNCQESCIGDLPGSEGKVVVSGIGSVWNNNYYLIVGDDGAGELSITNGGLVSVRPTSYLAVDRNDDGDSFISMSTGGMLAIMGEASDSLEAFFELFNGDDGIDAIRWWNDSIEDWAPLTSATIETDYTLEYLTDGDLAGYTLLTVGTVPVPGDANRDGKVDGSDVTILAGNWQAGVSDGQTATRAMGDFNGDGQVDGSDVTILAGNWQYGVITAMTAVPEPGTMALILSALFMIGLSGSGRSERTCSISAN